MLLVEVQVNEPHMFITHVICSSDAVLCIDKRAQMMYGPIARSCASVRIGVRSVA